MGETSDIRYAPDTLRRFARALFTVAGLEGKRPLLSPTISSKPI